MQGKSLCPRRQASKTMLWSTVVFMGGGGGTEGKVEALHVDHPHIAALFSKVVAAAAAAALRCTNYARGTEKQDKGQVWRKCHLHTTLKKRKPSNKYNKSSMWKLCATGHLTWVSHSEAVLLCWPIFTLLDSGLKARKKHAHTLSSLVKPCIQSQKENHHSQLIIKPWIKKKKNTIETRT